MAVARAAAPQRWAEEGFKGAVVLESLENSTIPKQLPPQPPGCAERPIGRLRRQLSEHP
ncbi:MAG: hypothetical protein AAFZ15_22010 [Bacteroidota bacterium]